MVPVVAYSIATLTGISRVYENKHWSSDVLIGAVFGYAMGKLIYNKNNWGIHIKPATTPEVIGMTLIFPIP
ncbi:MAG: phosphatase PAP2 family protein [Bacteroidales bacterium]|nr:phosphatase PAP2 family protein [Bacteroidales bacterium]